MNVNLTVDIDKMTVGEKLGLMDRLWRDLSKEPENIEVPEWHLRRLEEAERSIADGTDEFIPLEVFEAELRERINRRNSNES